MSNQNNGHNDHNQNNKEVCLLIKVTQSTTPWEVKFSKTAKVSEVLSAVINKFSFATNGNYEIRLKANPNEALKPERTLVSYGLADDHCHNASFTDLGAAA